MTQMVLSMQELIQRCTVVTEEHFKAAIMRTYARKREYKSLGLRGSDRIDKQAKEGMKMLEPGTDSKAAWFDLNRMRVAAGNKYKVSMDTDDSLILVCAQQAGQLPPD